MDAEDKTVCIEGSFLLQENLDEFVDSILFETKISPELSIKTINGSDLINYSEYRENTQLDELVTSYNSDLNEILPPTYQNAFENNLKDIDTISIRCIDERCNSKENYKNQLSFATAGCGCCCENSEDISINETAKECLEIIKHWRKFNSLTELLTIQIQPHEDCGASCIALKNKLPKEQITPDAVNDYSNYFATKLNNRLTEVFKLDPISSHLKVVVVTLPIIEVFPKNIHIATSALICRLDIAPTSSQNTYTSFYKFNTLLGTKQTPLNTFVISGEDIVEDFHHIANAITIASSIATSDNGICNNSYVNFSHKESNLFNIYIEFNGEKDYNYLSHLISSLNHNLAEKELDNHIQIIAINKLG